MSQIALGTKVFSRAGRLSGLLDSVEDTPVDTVYVADDGEPSEDKTGLYEANYRFDLKVLDLEYDAGLGYGRNRIVAESSRRGGGHTSYKAAFEGIPTGWITHGGIPRLKSWEEVKVSGM